MDFGTCFIRMHNLYHGPPKPIFLEVFMVNNMVFRWRKPVFFMVFLGGSWYIYIWNILQIFGRFKTLQFNAICSSYHPITWRPACSTRNLRRRRSSVHCGRPWKNCRIFFCQQGVSENGGTPKSSILIGFSIIFTIHFGVFPLIFGNFCGFLCCQMACCGTNLCHNMPIPFEHSLFCWAESMLIL